MRSAFVLLVRHFFGRFFDNDIVSQQGDMRTNMVQALGLAAVPGMFVAFSLLPMGCASTSRWRITASCWPTVISSFSIRWW